MCYNRRNRMTYSIISTIALILNLIIIRETLINLKSQTGTLKAEQKFITRYRYFLITANFYLNIPVAGQDFFVETPVNIDKYVHPDDRDFAKNLHRKETLLKNLEGRQSYVQK